MSRTLIFGGCFDPFHMGHTTIIEGLIAHFPEDRIVVLPTSHSPGKVAHSASIHRLALTQLALQSYPSVILDTRELFQPGPIFTIDTLQSLKQDYPALHLVIGYDQFQHFHLWKNPEQLRDILSGLVIINRGSVSEIPIFFRDYSPKNLHFLPIPPCDISSRDLRVAIKNDLLEPTLFPDQTLSYIQTHHLYQDTPKTIIGLTGRVGSGKSFAVQYLMLNADVVVIDLDILGHYLLESAEISQKLIALFGPDIATPFGKINRMALSEKVFSSSQFLAQLNAIVHPALSAMVTDYIAQSLAKNIIIVGALIEELGLGTLCSRIVAIDAEDRDIISNIGEKFDRISPFQRTREQYRSTATHIITNSFGPDFGPQLLETCNLCP